MLDWRKDMKNLTIILFLLVSNTLFCTQNRGEQATATKTEQNTKSEENLIVNSENLDFSQHKVTFIELGAENCIPCKAMKPVMQEIAEEYKGKIQVVFYDVRKDPRPSWKYGIRLIPTQVFIDSKGNEIFRHVGFFSKEDIVNILKEKGVI